MVLSPLSLLVVETETVVPAVRHQNVPHIINDNSGRVVELAVPSSGGSESSDGLEIVRVENVDLIPWVYILPRNPYFSQVLHGRNRGHTDITYYQNSLFFPEIL